MSWWSVSTTLWYGQRVEGLRPDVYIVDDSTRMDDNLGEVWDVFDKYLGKRPVFTDRSRLGWTASWRGSLRYQRPLTASTRSWRPDRRRMIDPVVSR